MMEFTENFIKSNLIKFARKTALQISDYAVWIADRLPYFVDDIRFGPMKNYIEIHHIKQDPMKSLDGKK